MALCSQVGMSRQNYYKGRTRRQERKLDILFTMLANNMSIYVRKYKVKNPAKPWSGNVVVERQIDRILKEFVAELRNLIKFEIKKQR